MDFIKDMLRGVAIGIANIVPGVSGGTMMVSMGIYDDVIRAVTGIFSHLKKSIRLLFPYALGMLIGIIGLSFTIGFLFEKYPFQTAMLFIGLILGGLPLILPKVKGARPSLLELILFVAFFALIVWMQFWTTGADRSLDFNPQTVVSLFAIGTVAAATMVIPGVSGSMLLMSLGYYAPIIQQINSFIVAAVTLNFDQLFRCMGVLVPFGLGVVVGVFLVAKLVEYLLAKHERKTYFAILGLLASSPVAVFSSMSLGTLSFGAILAGIILFVLGAGVAWLLAK
ncbi:MAG: DUF368 domain-containing protein [Roseburia sp.]|nr:DUF368 domain-containing protein [Roseburia sp.]